MDDLDIILAVDALERQSAKLRKELQVSAKEIMRGEQMKNEPIWVLYYPANVPKVPVQRLLAPAPEGGMLKTMQNVVDGYIEVIPHPDVVIE